MLSTHNILSPAHGRPVSIPSQDIVLGCYYLTKAKNGDLGEGKLFSSLEEVFLLLKIKLSDFMRKLKFELMERLLKQQPVE